MDAIFSFIIVGKKENKVKNLMFSDSVKPTSDGLT